MSGIIMLNVVGTNPTTRTQKPVTARFDVATGALISGEGPFTMALAVGSAVPDFPIATYQVAQAANDLEAVSKILIAHAEQVKAAKASGGGSRELQIAREAQRYCVEKHGFIVEDGDGYVLKLENLDVQVNKLPDGGELFVVAGTAVFGR